MLDIKNGIFFFAWPKLFLAINNSLMSWWCNPEAASNWLVDPPKMNQQQFVFIKQNIKHLIGFRLGVGQNLNASSWSLGICDGHLKKKLSDILYTFKFVIVNFYIWQIFCMVYIICEIIKTRIWYFPTLVISGTALITYISLILHTVI